MNGLLPELTLYMLAAQAVGVLGLAMNFLSYQQNTNRRIVGFQIFGALFWTGHFIMLGAVIDGAYTGAVMNIIGLLRNCVFFLRRGDNKPNWASHVAWLYIFCALYVVTGILTYDSLVSLLPIAAMIFGTVALFVMNPKMTRRLALACSVGWFSYDVLVFSVAGLVSEIFTLSSIIIAMVKFDFRKKGD